MISNLVNEIAQSKHADSTLVKQMMNEGFTEAQVKAMIFILFFAGQDTTANTLNYILLKTAQNSNIQKDIQNKVISINDLIVEGLRMMCAAGFIARIAKENLILTVKNADNKTEQLQYLIKKGDKLSCAPTMLARNPLVVKAKNKNNLEEFLPYRWKYTSHPVNLIHLPWKPFGGDKHGCPGYI